MEISVTIVFSGLMLLAAERDRNEGMMLLVNAAEHVQGSHVPHQAVLRFSCGDLEATQFQQLCVRLEAPSGLSLRSCGDGTVCIPVENFDISILPDGSVSADSLKLSEGKKSRDARFHSDTDEEDLGWVPDLREILSFLELPSMVPSQFLQQPLDPSLYKQIIGRVRLSGGALRVKRFETGYKDWQFRTKNSYAVRYRQEVAENLEYRSPVGTRNVVVRIAKSDGQVLLDLRYEGNGVLRIFNEPAVEDFCKIYKNSIFSHFSLYYELVGLAGADLPVPYSLARPDPSCREFLQSIQPGSETGGGLGPVICMSAQTTTEEFPVWR
jgi:hypothetical protein